ncbi:MAG TPA: magnesium-translocating P-type ATPase [Anaerolineales bacterium]|nr:magnesium-translocating P-type ATPase [Anaerolineales bacterium]
MNGIPPSAYWSRPTADLLTELRSTPDGLSTAVATERLIQAGPNLLKPRRHDTALRALLGQFTSPLVLILVFAAVVSAVARQWTDAAIVIVIVVASAVLSFAQEYAAGHAVERLRAQVTMKATALRDGQPRPIPAEEIVPGDVVMLSAGSLIPADGVVLEARDFFVNQAVLTGETFPVEKKPGPVGAAAGLSDRVNAVFMGTNVRSGTARVLIVVTGGGTAFGQIAERLTHRPPETEFERGIRRFGSLLTQIMTALVLAVFAINVILHKPPIDSLLFAIALAVGIAPELLPAVISITLSKGAQAMARRGVIVRRLNAIENLGSMDTLCTDKTGTLTEGVVRLDGAFDAQGLPSDDVLRWAYLNAAFQTGLANPLDEAILAQPHPDTTGMDKLEEIPYDFIRKRLSVVVDADPGTEIKPLLITKGALENILAICTRVREGELVVPLDRAHHRAIDARYAEWSAQGNRVLGLAVRDVPRQASYTVDSDECDMIFAGFLLFFDPPKRDARDTLAALAGLGVQVKIITGDNRLVARQVAGALDLPIDSILPASDMEELSEEALWNVAERTSIFAEVDPNQKERIILALRRMGHVVGYMGDGINDAPALHAADIGISVDQAVDVAKEAADFVLLRRDLGVLRAGIEEGRRTFANTLKYIFTTTSANFGNMLSMAGASLFLPFLPLLAKQILLNNFLSDIPAIGIAGDNVDPDMVAQPHRWNIRFIRDFMIIFGVVSSIFDYATFGLLILVLHATEQQFQTGWFVESLLTELVVALVVRTRRPFFRSRPGKLLWTLTLAISLMTLAIPYLPYHTLMGFTPLPGGVMAALLAFTALYVAAAELAKKFFYARVGL